MTNKHTPESQWVINYLMGIQRTGRHVPIATMLLVADSESAAISERDHLREVNAELLVALDRLIFAAEGRDNTMGDQSRLIDVKAALVAATVLARSVSFEAKNARAEEGK